MAKLSMMGRVNQRLATIRSKRQVMEEIFVMAMSTGSSISRRLPQSDEGRMKALQMIKAKNDALGANSPLPAAFQNRLNNIHGLFIPAMTDRGVKLSDEGTSTTQKLKFQLVGVTTVSQFFKHYNDGVRRKKYKAEDRAKYGLPINSARVPSLTSEAKLTLWGGRIITGEPLRIAAGGTAMADPDLNEIQTAMSDFINENTNQSGKKDAFDTAQQVVAALRPEADDVIKIAFNTVEATFSNESHPSRRRKMREWGAVYVSNTTLTFNVVVTSAATGEPVPGTSAELVQTGNKKTTGANGTCIVKSKIAVEEGNATFHFENALFAPHADVDVPLVDGQLVYNVNVVLASLP